MLSTLIVRSRVTTLRRPLFSLKVRPDARPSHVYAMLHQRRCFSGRQTLRNRLNQHEAMSKSKQADEHGEMGEEALEAKAGEKKEMVEVEDGDDDAVAGVAKVDISHIPEEMLRLTKYGRTEVFTEHRDALLKLEEEMKEQADLELVELSEEKLEGLSKLDQYRKKMEMQVRHKDILVRTEAEFNTIAVKLQKELQR